MSTFFNKHSFLISLLLILAVFVTAWLVPSIGTILVIALLLFSLVIAGLMIVKKHRDACLQGKISRTVLIRNVCLEITGILIALVLAAFLGRMFAEIATRSMSNDQIRLIAGIVIGLLVGAVVGVLIKRLSSRLLEPLSKSR